MSLDEAPTPRSGRVLQAHVLWDYVLPVHGGHAFVGVREQVRFLLETSQEPGGHGVEVEIGRPGDDRPRLSVESPSPDEVGGLFFDFEPFRTASRDHDAPRVTWSPRRRLHDHERVYASRE